MNWKAIYKELETNYGWTYVYLKILKSPTRNVCISRGALMPAVINITGTSYCKLPAPHECQIQIDIQNKLIYFCDIGDINIKYIAMDAS